jgi:serine/threonine protein kinase
MQDRHGHWAVLKIANRQATHNATRVGVPIDVLHELHVLRRVQDPHIIRLLAFELSYTDLCLWKSKDVASVNLSRSSPPSQQSEKNSSENKKPVPKQHHDPYPGISFRPFTYLLLEAGEENMAQWRQQNSPEISAGAIIKAARDMFQALQALHRHNICHNDLKPENFIRIGCEFKLSDFGIATHCNAYQLKRSEVQPKMFRAPELILNSTYYNYSTGIDIWAAGLILCILVFGGVNCRSSLVTSAKDIYGIMGQILLAIGAPDEHYITRCRNTYGSQSVRMDTKIVQILLDVQAQGMTHLSHEERRESLHTHFTNIYGNQACEQVIAKFTEPVYHEFVDLVAHCLQYAPEKRPSALQCLSHPFLKRI